MTTRGEWWSPELDSVRRNAPPAHWDPVHFKRGEHVMYSGYHATVLRHYHEGMWEIRVSGSGYTVVSGADLVRDPSDETVVARTYPKAWADYTMPTHWDIFTWSPSTGTMTLGSGDSKAAAWADAAKRLQ